MGATTCDRLAALPFSEVWCIDFEYYPGRGLANGGVDGDPVTPLCLVAHEVRSGRTIRLWQDELGPFSAVSTRQQCANHQLRACRRI